MPWINTLPFDLNRFWEKTPTPLKYLLLAAIIFVASYILFSRTGTTIETNRLRNIQEGIDKVYIVVENFEKFQTYQMEFNKVLLQDINNLHEIINESSYVTNEKIGYVIKHHDETDTQLMEKMKLLDSSFSKIINAYSTSTKYPILPEFKEYKK